MTDPENLFAGKASIYSRYRPGYPREIIQILEEETGFNNDWKVADIGSGTGILSGLFIENGNTVYCVEPNYEMQSEALRRYDNLGNHIPVTGTAEHTNLREQSIDLIVAGQSFHWFNTDLAKEEFGRIIRPGGFAALIWNNRSEDEGTFSREYDKICVKYSRNYHGTGSTAITEETFQNFFTHGYRRYNIQNYRQIDQDGVVGRYLSAIYALKPEDSDYGIAMKSLMDLFRRFQKDGKVTMEYTTEIVIGKFP